MPEQRPVNPDPTFSPCRAAFEALVAASQVSGLRPVIGRSFAFEDFREVHRYLASGQYPGKVAIRIVVD